MTVKFTARNANEDHTSNGEMTDMGQLYVSRFEIGGEIIYSFSPVGVTAEQRIENDEVVLSKHNWYDIVSLL